MDPREEIGKRIYELRRYFKITQKELCEGICTQAYISKIENGSLAIAADILFEIAERLGVDINYFYESTYNQRVDYALEVELEARQLAQNDEHEKLYDLIKREEKTPLMHNNKFKQFILWHKSLCLRFIDENFEEAEKLLDEALSLFNTSVKSYSEKEIQILINKANLYIDQRRFDEAISIYKTAKSALSQLPYVNDRKLQTMIHYNLSRTHYKLGTYNEAIDYAQLGIEVCKNNQSLYGFGYFYFIIGGSHIKMKNYSIGLEYLDKAKDIFKLTNNHSSIEKINLRIEEVREEMAML